MNVVPWDPGEELHQLRSEIDRLWDAFNAKLTCDREGDETVGFLPEVDFVETAHDYRLFVAIPGLVENDIDIEVVGHTLTMRGERHPPYDLQRQHTREWRYGFFERSITFTRPLNPEQIRATFDAGVLTLVVPKEAERSPRS